MIPNICRTTIINALPIFTLLFLADGAKLNDDKPTANVVQHVRDEFNTSETISNIPKAVWIQGDQRRSTTDMAPLRHILMQFDLEKCCPSWQVLRKEMDQVFRLRFERDQSLREKQSTGSFYTLGRSKKDNLDERQTKSEHTLEPSDLLNELSGTVFNITQLSIDGQLGQTEAEKYYKFLDNVQYYLRLLKVAQSYLDERENLNNTAKFDKNTSVDAKEINQVSLSILTSDYETFNYRLSFRRRFEGLKFKVAKDPMLSSFIKELTSNGSRKGRHNFDLYESFIKRTNFGHQYAKNISMIRESVRLFDHISQQLSKLNFPSNLTKPSKQYEMLHRMARRLFKLRHDLTHQINVKILGNRVDTRRLFERLDELIDVRPEIKILGDEFGDENEEEKFFSQNVRRLNTILHRYTTNNMTRLTFYNCLSELPEEFIVLGMQIAREYEYREVPQSNQLDLSSIHSKFQTSTLHASPDHLTQTEDSDSTTSTPTDPRHSSDGFFSSILG